MGGRLSVVFDSSALLAISFDEAGAERAARGLKDGMMSAVNVAEVISRYVDQGASEEEARASLQAFGLEIRPFDETQAMVAGLMRTATQKLGLSLGDRACLALAVQEGATVFTADRTWAALDLEVDVELIR